MSTETSKRVFILIGCPASGKSTYAKKAVPHDGYIKSHISSDEIRWANPNNKLSSEKVFREMFRRLKEDLLDDKDKEIYYDATNLSRKRRTHLYKEIKRISINEAEVIAMVFPMPLKMLLERNSQRTGWARVPEEVICRMYSQLEPPAETVDCDDFLVIKRPEILAGFYEEIMEYEREPVPHDTPYHMESVQEHIKAVCEKTREAIKSGEIFFEERYIFQAIAHFHDLGKYYVKKVGESGYATYKCHENVSAMYYMGTEFDNYRDEASKVILDGIYLHMQVHQFLKRLKEIPSVTERCRFVEEWEKKRGLTRQQFRIYTKFAALDRAGACPDEIGIAKMKEEALIRKESK